MRESRGFLNAMIILVRWLARLGSAVLLIGVGLYVYREGFQSPMGDPEMFNKMLMSGVMLAGLFIGWKWEGLGGGLTLAGSIGYVAVDCLAVKGLAIEWRLTPFVVVALMYLWVWRKLGG